MRQADFAITSGYCDGRGPRDDVTWQARLGTLFGCWMNRYRQRHALSLLDDRMFKDIGITRLDAANEIDKPFWQS